MQDATTRHAAPNHHVAKNAVIIGEVTNRSSFRPTFRLIDVHGLAGALGLALCLVGGGARSQPVDCGALQAEIAASAGRPDDEAAALLEARSRELQRAQDYLDSLGCNAASLPFFDAPAECQAIGQRVGRLRAQVERLQAEAHGGADGDESRRRALVEQYNAACDARNEEPAGDPETGPSDAASPGPTDDAKAPAGDVKALCVRRCDGGYFPITDRTPGTDARLKDLDTLCTALCPGAEAALYTTAPTGGLETATARDGSPYTALPTAFKFQKSYDAACSCKPPHQSWAEALAGAEKLIEADKADVTVTQKMSDDMSRPDLGKSSQAKPGKTASRDPKAPVAKPGRSAKRKPSAGADSLADQAPDRPPPVGDAGQDVMRQLRRDAPAL